MSFLVDTDIISAHLRGTGQVTNRFLQHTGRLHVSAVTLAELKTWIYRHNTPTRYVQAFHLLLGEFQLLPVDEPVTEAFGRIGADLFDRGTPLATPDLLIASTAIVHGLSVVSHNLRDFSRVPGLTVVDWLQP